MQARYDHQSSPTPAAAPQGGSPEPTPEQAEATIRETLNPTWARRFNQHQADDGSTFWVDIDTGQTYDTFPALHDKDGRDT